MAELERIYEGPLRGLQIAPEFYKLLGSAELKNTPLGRSLKLQNQLLGEVSAGLGGRAFGQRRGKTGAGALPPDMVSAIGEEMATAQGARGIEGSPASAIAAAMRFSGASEQIRAQRLASAQSVLGQVGGASIMPSASEFLGAGVTRATTAANIQAQLGMKAAEMAQQRESAIFSGIGQIAGLGAGLLTGGASTAAAGALGGAVGGGIMDPYQVMRSVGARPNYGSGNMPFGFGGTQDQWITALGSPWSY